MTKRRPPLSIDAALARIAGHIPGGYAEMARVVERSEGMLRAYGDPDRRELLPMEDGIALDLAYRAAGGEGAPLFEAYAHKLDSAGVDFFADQIALGLEAVKLIRECSDAEAAMVIAAQPGATPRDRANATREIEEAMAVMARARLMLGSLPVQGIVEKAAQA